jgi:hypothetical protein
MLGKPFTSSKSRREEGGTTSFGDAFGITNSKEPVPVKEISAEQAILLERYPFSSSSTKNEDVQQ